MARGSPASWRASAVRGGLSLARAQPALANGPFLVVVPSSRRRRRGAFLATPTAWCLPRDAGVFVVVPGAGRPGSCGGTIHGAWAWPVRSAGASASSAASIADPHRPSRAPTCLPRRSPRAAHAATRWTDAGSETSSSYHCPTTSEPVARDRRSGDRRGRRSRARLPATAARTPVAAVHRVQHDCLRVHQARVIPIVDRLGIPGPLNPPRFHAPCEEAVRCWCRPPATPARSRQPSAGTSGPWTPRPDAGVPCPAPFPPRRRAGDRSRRGRAGSG